MGLPQSRSWIGRGLLSPLPSFEQPDRVLQPRARNNPPRTAFPHPPKKSVVALQWFALTSHSEGRQILPRRRCVKIGFAARVKLCSALSRLSPAFETESVSPIGTSHSWPLPPGIRAHESQSVPHHPTPGHFYGFCSGPPLASALSPCGGLLTSVIISTRPLLLPIFHAAARKVFQKCKSDHIILHLRALRCLPVTLE